MADTNRNPLTRRYLRALLRFLAAARGACEVLDRVHELRSAGLSEHTAAGCQDMMATANELFEEANTALIRATADAQAAWETGAERPPPRRWILRKLAEGDQLQARALAAGERARARLAAQ